MYCLFGAGIIGEQFLESLLRNDFSVYDLCIVDSDANKVGKTCCGLSIESPSKRICACDIQKVVVTVQSSESYNEIYSFLTNQLGVTAEKVIAIGDAVIVPDNPNMGDIIWKNKEGHRIVSREELANELKSDLKNSKLNDLESFYFFSKHRTIMKAFHYYQAYNTHFEKYRRKDNVKLLEIGVGGGGSLQMWKDYFSKFGAKVEIYGIDIIDRCKTYEEDGIKIFIGSQENREFLRSVKSQIGDVDIIIDDSGHTMNQQIVSFEELFDCVLPGGIYLCEDTGTSYLETYGGGYKKRTFIEYSKELIDGIYKDYMQNTFLVPFPSMIKSISYYSAMVFIEKNNSGYKNMELKLENV